MRDAFVNLWRTLVLWALMFWQGGFLFYASAVVPTAQTAIGHREQGFITRTVTVWINNAALLSLGMLALDAAVLPDPHPWRRRGGWSLWLILALCQIALAILHPNMDALLDPETHAVGEGFRWRHRTYLWVHTAQFVAAIGFTMTMLAAWRARDRSG